ncbi:MAG: hypothetical protein QM674_13360 [Burkholderiaceae bacterium]
MEEADTYGSVFDDITQLTIHADQEKLCASPRLAARAPREFRLKASQGRKIAAMIVSAEAPNIGEELFDHQAMLECRNFSIDIDESITWELCISHNQKHEQNVNSDDC